jgi:MFS transporter, sugar porter (SP) family|nr:sugar porter family MFS transporter [uncultured Steroidobacter sp.]
MLQGKLNIAFVALTVAIGGFLLGFDATVISGVVPFIKEYFSLSGASGDLKLGFAVSSLGWGAMAGNALAGPLSDRFGRRRVLLGTALLFVLSSLLAATATSFPSFVVARIVGGLAVGGAILIAPVYIAEIAPADKRGGLVSLNQLMIVIGISASFFSNYFLLDLGEHNWRYMLGVQMVPAVLYFTLLWFVPESPRWLLLKRRDEAALAVLRRVAGEQQAQENLQQIQRSLNTKAVSRGFRGLLDSRVRLIMIVALGLAFFQQITGINAIFYYLPTIFAEAGGGVNDAFRQAVLVGVVNVLMTFVAIWLIDKLGRKPLLLMGIAGMALSLFAISWAFGQESYNARLVLIAIIGFVASFAISLGPVMWVLLSEIFPNEQRAAAISVAGFWNALVSATVTMIFPWALSTLSSSLTFLAFALFATAALLFVVLLVPETKGRTLEQLESDLMTAKA